MHNLVKAKRAGALRRKLAVMALVPLAAATMWAQDENAEPGHPQPAATTAESASTETHATAAAPTSPTGEKMVGFVASNQAIERVLAQLSDQAGVSISARGKVAGVKVSFIQPKKIPLRDALNQIVNQQPNWLLYEPADHPGTFEIWDQDTYKAEVLPRLVRPKVFVPKEITAEEAAKALDGIKTPNIGTVAVDPRSNKVFMTDLVPVLELAQRLIEQIDVKFLTRVYYIQHADVTDVGEKLSALKSPAAPDIQVDTRTHQIIVQDRLDILQKMEQLVETLDIGPEMRVYDLNNIGVDGEDLDDLEDAIQEILTPDAYYKINIRAGKLIVRDMPEVQDRVEKVLEAFDSPIKQVLLQAEVIETEFSDGFNWQVDYAFSGDLFSSVIDGLTGRVPAATGSTGATGSGGTVPVGSQVGTDGTIDPTNLGFLNFRKEFPILQGGSTGINAQMLTRHAYVKLAAAMSDSRTRVLQQPRMLVENQKTASFDVGQKVPFFTGGSIGTVGTGNGQVLTPSQPVQQFLNVGLHLEITPIISNNNLVEMEILVENTTAFKDNTLQFNGQNFTGVGSNNQELDTNLWIPSGETRVIGGLIADSKSETKSGIPGLIKIPVIGPALFGSYNRPADANRRRNLLIFLTPTIVEEKVGGTLKYKGHIVDDQYADDLTTPAATLTDLPMSEFQNINSLPPDKGTNAPSPLPGFDSLDNSSFPPSHDIVPQTDEQPPSIGVKATVQPGIELQHGDILPESVPGNGEVTDLKRINIHEQASTDTLSSLIHMPSPNGMLTTGGKNLIKSPTATQAPTASTPAPYRVAPQPGQGQPTAVAGQGVQNQQTAPAPGTETRVGR